MEHWPSELDRLHFQKNIDLEVNHNGKENERATFHFHQLKQVQLCISTTCISYAQEVLEPKYPIIFILILNG